MSYRLEKFASTLRQALGEILTRDSLNPDFKFVSIVEVRLAPDLKKATIFITSPLGGLDGVLEQLKRSQGFIKRQLDRKMILRHMPELHFLADATRELDQKISGLKPEGDHEKNSR